LGYLEARTSKTDRALRDGPPKLTPQAKLAETPISDDETVAKMGPWIQVPPAHLDFRCGLPSWLIGGGVG
jgi:hypothetical protein